MGRKKRRCRTWQRKMKSKGRRRQDYYPRWDDISPSRLVAWAEPETPKIFYPTGMEKESNGGRPAQCK